MCSVRVSVLSKEVRTFISNIHHVRLVSASQRHKSLSLFGHPRFNVEKVHEVVHAVGGASNPCHLRRLVESCCWVALWS